MSFVSHSPLRYLPDHPSCFFKQGVRRWVLVLHTPNTYYRVPNTCAESTLVYSFLQALYTILQDRRSVLDYSKHTHSCSPIFDTFGSSKEEVMPMCGTSSATSTDV